MDNTNITTKKSKPRFGVPSDLSEGLSEVASAIEERFRTVPIPIGKLDPDPENPRRLSIETTDLLQGPDKGHPEYKKKIHEYEQLLTLADSIKKDGLLNPVTVYEHNSRFILVAGERRLLATIITGERKIEARIFKSRPSLLSIRRIQWVENEEREDLSLGDKFNNLKQLIEAHVKENPNDEVTSELISILTGRTVRQARTYLKILNDPLVLEAIEEDKLKTLDSAFVIAGLLSDEQKKNAINFHVLGGGIKRLKEFAENPIDFTNSESKFSHIANVKGIAAINLGKIKNIKVAKIIADALSAHPEAKKYAGIFNDIDWNNPLIIKKAFSKYIKLFEKNCSE
jgi:ParB family chromosome partitioning protein